MEFHIVARRVGEIINQENKNQQTIERILDDLLNHLQWDGRGEEEFLCLNLYYLTTNKQDAIQYYDNFKERKRN